MTARIAVVGLGKIGLPLAAQYASRGMHVVGCDVSPAVVESVNAGRSHVREEPGLDDAVTSAVRAGMLCATTDTSAAVAGAGVVVVIVPLMVGARGVTDFSSLDGATEAVARGLRGGTLVVYETTLPVGTTRRRLGPMLEQGSGLSIGSNLHLAFSPERVYSGRVFEDLRRYPKIVGGVDAASTQKAVEFYRAVLDADVWPVENAETAEFAKLAETTYRDVNIALANELALYGATRGVNVADAFAAANSQPYSHIHRPSVGVGGHCIPVYPHFLLQDARADELSLVRDGRRTNEGMAAHGVDQLAHVLGGLGSRRVLVLGAAYREDVKELAFSTVFPLLKLLRGGGAEVLLSDPLFQPDELRRLEAEIVDWPLTSRALDVDAIVVQAWHRDFRHLDWARFKCLKVVLDGRGAVDSKAIRSAGATYLAIGSSGDPTTAPEYPD